MTEFFKNMLTSFVSVCTNEVQMSFCCHLFSFNIFALFTGQYYCVLEEVCVRVLLSSCKEKMVLIIV